MAIPLTTFSKHQKLIEFHSTFFPISNLLKSHYIFPRSCEIQTLTILVQYSHILDPPIVCQTIQVLFYLINNTINHPLQDIFINGSKTIVPLTTQPQLKVITIS